MHLMNVDPNTAAAAAADWKAAKREKMQATEKKQNQLKQNCKQI